jgi:hypothetical protein
MQGKSVNANLWISHQGLAGIYRSIRMLLKKHNSGDTAFTVPMFDQYTRRIMPGDDWLPPLPKKGD